jgi:nucleoside-diphosphate-sugar epimerase
MGFRLVSGGLEMRCVVTGVAGFIGSHLAERLVRRGHIVIGVDKFSDYYDPSIKKSNLLSLIDSNSFSLIQKDVASLTEMELADADVIFHLAAQPGVRGSWGKSFDTYVADNILATQRLLELSRHLKLKRFVFASSSSVYGEMGPSPTTEDAQTKPFSPYGVTKLAAENLCMTYYENYSMPVVTLRYFTVYGPRQRPDMAFHRFISAATDDRPLVIYGNGSQKRDFTFVSDAVDANISCIEADCVGKIMNIAGGRSIQVIETVRIIEELTGKSLRLKFESIHKGDVSNTMGDITLARETLAYAPKIALEDGLKQQLSWMVETGRHQLQ